MEILQWETWSTCNDKHNLNPMNWELLEIFLVYHALKPNWLIFSVYGTQFSKFNHIF